MKNHPKYLNGEATEEDLYIKFLQKFETNGLNGKNEKDSVGDGKVLYCVDHFNFLHNQNSFPKQDSQFAVQSSAYK